MVSGYYLKNEYENTEIVKVYLFEGIEKMVSQTCFISYSWDNNDHKDWVRCLADKLQHNGVHVYLDQWDSYPGMDLTNYMESCIRNSDFVLLVCTPIFAIKANAGVGGVGYEKGIVTGEIFEGAASPKKFVPLLRQGSPKESLPSYLKSRIFIDFREDNLFEPNLEILLRHLFQSPKYIRPPLGQKPNLSTQEPKKLKITTQPNETRPPPTFQIFQEVFEFARDPRGLYKYTSQAEAYAKDWVEQFSDKDFQVFKEAFEFARNPRGLDKYTSQAEAYDREWISK